MEHHHSKVVLHDIERHDIALSGLHRATTQDIYEESDKRGGQSDGELEPQLRGTIPRQGMDDQPCDMYTPRYASLGSIQHDDEALDPQAPGSHRRWRDGEIGRYSHAGRPARSTALPRHEPKHLRAELPACPPHC